VTTRAQNLVRTVWLAAVLALAGCATVAVPRPPEIAARSATLTERERNNLEVFDAVWSLVRGKFYDPKLRNIDWNAAALKYEARAVAAPDDEKLYDVVNEMLGELKESHNWASSRAEIAARRDPPKARVGVSLWRIEEQWLVVDVLPGSPAEEAGVRRGWIFTARNGRSLGAKEEFALQEGESVTDTFLDQHDQSHSLALTARPLSARISRDVNVLDGGVLLLRFNAFDVATRRWLSEQLKLHRDAPAAILDLRGNPGGGMFSLGITVGEFFSRPVSWGTLISRNGKSDEHDSWQFGSARYAGRVAVLVGEHTGSCAEILARVLQFHHRGTVIGRPTAGAVVGSVFYRLPHGGRLQLAVYDYHDPDGQRLEGVGVKPDVAVEYTFDSVAGLRANRDLDLEAALEALKNTPVSVAQAR
jgi:carboxyl-terminal processing protease